MRRLWRGLVPIAGLVASATLVAAQTQDPGRERTVEPAGQSGAAASHSDAANDRVSLTPDQRNRLKAYFAQSGASSGNADKPAFTVAIGAAVPKQIELRPLPHELATILPNYRGDQYVLVEGRMVIATADRRIVAIIPDVKG
ncbi:MAG TPA: DUF1236 domain-containing protein [Xanthobacteraceae bacterium]|nr:DUF1236 domain-containing protein [Xanthobacteraceae bacterium]